MSNKINILCIVKAHFNTLKDISKKGISKLDITTFIILPISLSLFSAYKNFNLNKDLDSLLVNFGAIFTALLLSVIVLISGVTGGSVECIKVKTTKASEHRIAYEML
ncbi:hypothetical protein D0759_23960 [Salmonella enterica]|nr:hypothetical protein [Salmonella enterica]